MFVRGVATIQMLFCFQLSGHLSTMNILRNVLIRSIIPVVHFPVPLIPVRIGPLFSGVAFHCSCSHHKVTFRHTTDLDTAWVNPTLSICLF